MVYIYHRISIFIVLVHVFSFIHKSSLYLFCSHSITIYIIKLHLWLVCFNFICSIFCWNLCHGVLLQVEFISSTLIPSHLNHLSYTLLVKMIWLNTRTQVFFFFFSVPRHLVSGNHIGNSPIQVKLGGHF